MLRVVKISQDRPEIGIRRDHRMIHTFQAESDEVAKSMTKMFCLGYLLGYGKQGFEEDLFDREWDHETEFDVVPIMRRRSILEELQGGKPDEQNNSK